LLGISEAAQSIGFRTVAARLSLPQLLKMPLPAIVHWQENHFVVIAPKPARRIVLMGAFIQFFKPPSGVWGLGFLLIADPSTGLQTLSQQEFIEGWLGNSAQEGIALLLEPTQQFYKEEDSTLTTDTSLSKSPHRGLGGWPLILGYLWQHRRLVIQLFVGLLVGSLLQLVFPFLTQSVIDIGVNTRQPSFIMLVLVAQLALTLGRTSVEFIRSWLLMYISSRLNLSLLSDFLLKLTKLPMSFFDVKQFGDIMQRISDHHRIEQFLTNQTLSMVFAMFNVLIFGVVLAAYSTTIFVVLIVATVLYGVWVMLFMKFRQKLDYQKFAVSSQSNSALIQLVQSMQEIKLANAETTKRWEWENLQARSVRLGMKGLSVSQWQEAGTTFINETKNVIITFLSAQAAIQGHLTLGGMLAVQYIVGQTNGPLQQLVHLLQNWQDAKISFERLNEVYELPDEIDRPEGEYSDIPTLGNRGIMVKNVTFSYAGTGNLPVLNDVSLYIPEGKTTAIVGMSGSGKTTLLKLLLRFYEPTAGSFLVGKVPLTDINPRFWRRRCGVVLQDGFIFSDSIANNIAVGASEIDTKRLHTAAEMANIKEFIDSLPKAFKTKIGPDGMGLSQGQKQRLLIARAIYKNPEYIFFDEATNALDTQNEAEIVNNLNVFFKAGKTVIIVAHRLSTVRNADQIVVMEKGRIVENGTHQDLIAKRGLYFGLVKNQLELSS
jgi:ATP-binding cassette, subfamily B, bacterial